MKTPSVIPLAAFAMACAAVCAQLPPTRDDALPIGVASSPLPAHLHETGLYVDGSTLRVRDENLPFSPQYPLWSDGTTKRRWIFLPPGSAIDASQPDAWQFPPGTRLWKEFSRGRRVETRFIERLADGSWRYATYLWSDDGSDAMLAPAEGTSMALASAPNRVYSVPSRTDCLACHEGASVPVLGFSALQLSSDRDPHAPHAEAPGVDHVDLRRLVSRGLVRNLPPSLLDKPPRVVASTATARAALGYLHGNCGHCHNAVGALAGLDLVLAQSAAPRVREQDATLQSLVGRASRYRERGADSSKRLVPGRADASVIAIRMQSTNPFARMPPLGVEIVDGEGLALVQRWIQQDVHNPQELSP
jgi:hypothetical protein